MNTSNASIHMRRLPLAACLAAVVAAAPSGAAASALSSASDSSRPATLLPVTDCADDGGAGTLRSVVATAISGDTIDLTQLTCSTITLVSGQILVAVPDLTILGPGRDLLAIDGNHQSSNDYDPYGRVFFHYGDGTFGAGSFTIEHITVQNGLHYPDAFYDFRALAYGGCIASRGQVTLNDVLVTGCRAITNHHDGSSEGGGVRAYHGMTVTDSVISNNQAIVGFIDESTFGFLVSGGGLVSRGAPMTVTNSQIINNRAQASTPGGYVRFQQASGGGIATFGDHLLSITDSVIQGNFAGCNRDGDITCYQVFGGGIQTHGGLTLESSIVSDNVAEANFLAMGSGIDLELGAFTQIRHSTISTNRSSVDPGRRSWGAILATYAPIEISDSTISGNSVGKGGGVFVLGYGATITNTTISGNTVSETGGAVFVASSGASTLSLKNSTVTLNSSTGSDGGGGIVDASNHAGATNLQSSIVAGNLNTEGTHTYDSDLGVVVGAIDGANNLIVAASGVTLPADTLSIDPMLGPLQDNGGLTWTHALLEGSPAIDVGNNAENLDFDQRGADYVRVSGAAADIGAFEVQPTSNDVIFANGFDNQ